VRLVGPNGEQVGIVRVEDALRLAAEADLDLVEVAPMAKPPVCKLMDFGKFKYEAAIKEREARKNQVNTVIKEIKLRPKIDPHDYGTKKGHVERFLKAGDKVKVTIMFRGREQSRPELGYRLLQRLAEDIGELGFVESNPKQDGRNMIMVLGPTKKKAEAKAEAKAERRRRDEVAPQVAGEGTHAAPVDVEVPAPQAAEPAPQAATPAPQAAEPAPQAATPAPQASEPAPQAATPAPQAPAPARQAAAPTPRPAPAPAAPRPPRPARPTPPAPRAPQRAE
jgi:translation initiation factor IF-3